MPRRDSEPPYSETPVVIFGTGGSGTRSLAKVVESAGYFMGTDLTRAMDSLDIAGFFDRWINRYVGESVWVDRVLKGPPFGDEPVSSEMRSDFGLAIERHRDGLSDKGAPWGWKGPRTMFVLPFLHHTYPCMMVIHLVRDGRDMAYSENQRQLRDHGSGVLSAEDRELPWPVQSIKLWSRINLAAARYCEQLLPGKYLRVRFEDLCSDPPASVAKLLDFTGCEAPPSAVAAIATAAIRPPRTINRWQRQGATELEAVSRAGRDVLEEFGYV
jgi:hypothetical protein